MNHIALTVKWKSNLSHLLLDYEYAFAMALNFALEGGLLISDLSPQPNAVVDLVIFPYHVGSPSDPDLIRNLKSTCKEHLPTPGRLLAVACGQTEKAPANSLNEIHRTCPDHEFVTALDPDMLQEQIHQRLVVISRRKKLISLRPSVTETNTLHLSTRNDEKGEIPPWRI